MAYIGIIEWIKNSNVKTIELQLLSGNFDFEFANRGNKLYKPKIEGHTILRFMAAYVTDAKSMDFFVDFTYPQLNPRSTNLIKVYSLDEFEQHNLTNIVELIDTPPVPIRALNLNLTDQTRLEEALFHLLSFNNPI